MVELVWLGSVCTENNAVSQKYRVNNEIVGVSKMFGGGRIQVPADVRKLIGITDGQKLVWKLKEGEIVVVHA